MGALRERDEGIRAADRSCAEFMKLLADDTRLTIIQELLAGPRHVYEINAQLGIDPTLLSHHLRVLRQAGLIYADRRGKSLLYRLAPQVRVAQGQRVIDFGCCEVSFSRSNPPPKQYEHHA